MINLPVIVDCKSTSESDNFQKFVQLPGGSALESGKICKGDRVVAVGGQDVKEAPVEDIAVHVKVSNPVQLKLARFKSAKQWQVPNFDKYRDINLIQLYYFQQYIKAGTC